MINLISLEVITQEPHEFSRVECQIIASFNQIDKEWQVMSRTAIGNRVRKIGEILGLEGFRNHSIRKTRLNQLAEHDILLAQAMGNHEDVSTTQKSYTKKKDANDVMKKIRELGL